MLSLFACIPKARIILNKKYYLLFGFSVDHNLKMIPNFDDSKVQILSPNHDQWLYKTWRCMKLKKNEKTFWVVTTQLIKLSLVLLSYIRVIQLS